METFLILQMPKTFIVAIAFLLFSSFQPGTKSQSLFDGTTFRGWQGDTANTWRIENETIIGGSLKETVPHNNFLATTKSYKNFDLRLQFKLTGTGFVNAGVQFRSQHSTNPSYEMIGYQADLGEGYWASLYDESRRNITLAKPDSMLIKRALRPDSWNDYRVRCEGNNIKIWLNGIQTVDYTETDKRIVQSGLIALQIHGGGKAEASYKNIRLAMLPDN